MNLFRSAVWAIALAAGGIVAQPVSAAPALKPDLQTGNDLTVLVQNRNAVARPAARPAAARAAPRAAVARRAVVARSQQRQVQRPASSQRTNTAQRTQRTQQRSATGRAAVQPRTATQRANPGLTTRQKVAIGAGVGAAAAGIAAANARSNAVSSGPRPAFQSKLTAPFKSRAYLQPGFRVIPGPIKPAFVVHNNYYVAGARGYRLGYRPFWYRFGGVRYYRYYYSVVGAGGLYYWYWHNCNEDEARTNFKVNYVSVAEADVIECDPDDDDCGEPA